MQAVKLLYFSNALLCCLQQFIYKYLLKRQPAPEKRSHIYEHSQQTFTAEQSTCAQWDYIPVNTAAEKSWSAGIFLQYSAKPFFMKCRIVHDDDMIFSVNSSTVCLQTVLRTKQLPSFRCRRAEHVKRLHIVPQQARFGALMRVLTRLRRLLRAFWRCICVWIPVSSIYEPFFRNVFNFFQIGFYLFGFLLFVKCIFFSRDTTKFSQPLQH